MTRPRDTCYHPKEKRTIEEYIYKDIPLKVYMADANTTEWYTDGFPRNEIDFLKITKNDLVFDIGAHQGVIACILSKISGHVVAVESGIHNVKAMRINRWANKITNLSIVHGYVCGPDAPYAEKYKLTIDKMAKKYGIPTVLYIDIEGMEGIALRGAVETLKHHPNMCIEMHMKGCGGTIFERGDTSESIFAAIPEGYKFFAAPHRDDCVVFEYNYEKIKDFDAFYLFCIKENK